MPDTNNQRVATHAGGRPTTYTKEIGDKICETIADGHSLRWVCRLDDMPPMRTVFEWLRRNKQFSQQYARACDERVEAMVEESFEIADDGTNDWMERKFGKDPNSTWVVNGEAVQRSKLRVDTRKWYVARMKPKKYGDKIDVTSDGEKLPAPITTLPIKELKQDG